MTFVFVSNFVGSHHVRFISQVEPLVVRRFHTSSTPSCFVWDLLISHWHPLDLPSPSLFVICTTKRCFIHILTNIKNIYIWKKNIQKVSSFDSNFVDFLAFVLGMWRLNVLCELFNSLKQSVSNVWV